MCDAQFHVLGRIPRVDHDALLVAAHSQSSVSSPQRGQMGHYASWPDRNGPRPEKEKAVVSAPGEQVRLEFEYD